MHSIAKRFSVLHLAGLALGAEVVWRLQPAWRGDDPATLGWVVPLAAAYLGWERWNDRPAASPAAGVSWRAWLALAAGAWVLALTRLLLEPWPYWPLPLWLFAGTAVALALGGITLTAGRKVARHFLFPVAFVVLALPWPALLESHVVLPLRGVLALIAAEMLGFLGHPALAHGTVVEVGNGMVGVDEACSGIRSLQAATLAALFLGELSRFTLPRRLGLLAVGLMLALGSNLARTVFLAWQSAVRGPGAVAAWHDRAGYALLGVCLGGLALVAWRWQRHARWTRVPRTPTLAPAPSPALARLAFGMIAAVLVIECGTQLWFAWGDHQARLTPRWTANLDARPGYQAAEFTDAMQAMLECDTHQLGRWTATGGSIRSGYVLEWKHGQRARFATRAHAPTVCLPFSGNRLIAQRNRVVARAGTIDLPFDAYVFASPRERLHVYHLVWDVCGGRRLDLEPGALSRIQWIRQRWSDVAQARRHLEATTIALAIVDAPDDSAADQAFREEISAIITAPNCVIRN